MGRVIISLTPDGKVKVEAIEFQGNSCAEATAFLQKLGVVQNETHKPEFYDSPLLEEGVRNNG